MKRTAMPPRTTRLRGSAPKRGTTMKKVNPERQAKRRKRQRSKHAAYMRSETRKIVDARAGDRCEALLAFAPGDRSYRVVERQADAPRGYFVVRCAAIPDHHHHLTYARYGGDELQEDMLKVCKRCHDYFESQHPTRQSHLRQAGRARQETE